MKSTLFSKMAILLTGLAISTSVYAGINIKSRHIVGGNQQNSEINRSGEDLAQQKLNNSTETGIKKEVKVRIGLANVKAGTVGEEINGQELAGAIQNSLSEYLKGTKIELVPLESRLAANLESEAKDKQCEFIIYVQISHKKGSSGFGMLKAIAPILTNVIPMAGGMGGIVAGSVASTVITTAAATTNVKPKDD